MFPELPCFVFFKPLLPLSKGLCMYRMNVDRSRWKLLAEACDFFFYLCDVSRRVNEPQQIARKDILMSAHASPCLEQRLFFTPVREMAPTASFMNVLI